MAWSPAWSPIVDGVTEIDAEPINDIVDKISEHDDDLATLNTTVGQLGRVAQVLVTDPAGDALVTGDGQAFLLVPSQLNGRNITSVAAAVTTQSSSGAVTVQVARVRGGTPVDVLSTALTIDANETTSYTAATPAVINTSNDDLATGDLLRIDVDGAGTGAKGLIVSIGIG
jgi:hypothetical protein